MVVECTNGKCFIEQEFGKEYSQFAGIVKSSKDRETEPTFYSSVDDAARAAFGFIKKVYPSTPKARLVQFLEDQ
jgi:hypothetical protein